MQRAVLVTVIGSQSTYSEPTLTFYNFSILKV
jgi:hypothetical protein